MVQTLEAIRGGGGSIKVGTTGTVSFLMTREMESVKSAPQMPTSTRHKNPTLPISVPSGASTPKTFQPRASDQASSSGTSSSTNHGRYREVARKTKVYNGKTQKIPMLGSENIAMDSTPSREKFNKKGSYIVEVVDIKCGDQNKAWTSPITYPLKKLGFSKLSESIG
ncbi:hypothetical protein RJ641_034582 [Dillenia turbinata]|uniref:Uncharacterized protein n=1 Tax=Dillenia turbinata TaxID=194707 RepID=A0AAN8ZE45_9MAGN